MLKSKSIFSPSIAGVLSLLLFALGFLLSFWPLCFAGLLLSGAMGRYAIVVAIGVGMDIVYGPPVGRLASLHVPFTLLAFVLVLLHYNLSVYFRDSSTGRL